MTDEIAADLKKLSRPSLKQRDLVPHVFNDAAIDFVLPVAKVSASKLSDSVTEKEPISTELSSSDLSFLGDILRRSRSFDASVSALSESLPPNKSQSSQSFASLGIEHCLDFEPSDLMAQDLDVYDPSDLAQEFGLGLDYEEDDDCSISALFSNKATVKTSTRFLDFVQNFQPKSAERDDFEPTPLRPAEPVPLNDEEQISSSVENMISTNIISSDEEDRSIVIEEDMPTPEEIMMRLKASMNNSSETMDALQEWDRANGLPKSHSQTMVNTSRSREQLRTGAVLQKWNGVPLLKLPGAKIKVTRKVFRGERVRELDDMLPEYKRSTKRQRVA